MGKVHETLGCRLGVGVARLAIRLIVDLLFGLLNGLLLLFRVSFVV